MKQSTNFNQYKKVGRGTAEDIVSTLSALGFTDAQIRTEFTPMVPSPKCSICADDGYYLEDVCGDGGPRERIVCECQAVQQ